jgi:ArsR family metal-binding transcriptional regulator
MQSRRHGRLLFRAPGPGAVSGALPYLNTLLGRFEYLQNPPSVTFKAHGKLITVHGRKIAVNALKDEAEARKIIEWLKREINDAWNRRDQIEPSTQSTPRPKLFDILKLLPKTNCKACGEPTCMVFAARVAEGAKGIQSCPELTPDAQSALDSYLSKFHLLD